MEWEKYLDFNDKDISKNGNKFKRNKENKEKKQGIYLWNIIFLMWGEKQSGTVFGIPEVQGRRKLNMFLVWLLWDIQPERGFEIAIPGSYNMMERPEDKERRSGICSVEKRL